MKPSHFTPGISVILPTYNNSPSLERAIDSLRSQTLSNDLFEVIVVLNGQYDNSEKLLLDDTELNLRIFKSAQSGAGRARNLGLALVRRSHVTFLDDDDYLEPNFLHAAWETVTPTKGALLGIRDEDTQGNETSSSLNARINPLQGVTVPVTGIPWALGFNACKVIPTHILTRYRYNESLKSGEDVAFFANLLKHPELVLTVPKHQEARYVRILTDDSVSRREESFDFNVAQRLDVIGVLQSLDVPESAQAGIVSLTASQFRFVEDYLSAHPNETGKAAHYASKAGAVGLEINKFGQQSVDRAVFSYCFPPYADTAGNVAAKRIRATGQIVDVYSATMDQVRAIDSSSLLMVEPYMRHHDVIAVVPSFADWQAISDWALKAFRRAQQRDVYKTIYSRSMWSASHVAALLYKFRNPRSVWAAEFSDPMRIDAEGHQRPGKLSRGRVTSQFKKMAKRAKLPETDSHFVLTEALTMYYADELVFTNKNQRDLMLSYYSAELRSLFLEKARILPQLQPDKGLYGLRTTEYALKHDEVNIGYFGSFYSNRGIGDVAKCMNELPADAKHKLRLHIFTSAPEKVRTLLTQIAPSAKVDINSGVPYLEFLNLAAQFDVLIVNDTDISGTNLPVNPFLPSKYADYAGAGTPIWGITTDGSPLSEQMLDYRSQSGDFKSISGVLLELISSGK